MPRGDQRTGSEEQEYYTLTLTSSRIDEKSSYGGDSLQKTYDMVLQNWIIEFLKMYKISGEVIKFIEKTIRVELRAGEKDLY